MRINRSRRRPVFSALNEARSWDLLRRNHVGRLCFLNGTVVDVEPVHYVLGDGWLFVRSAHGTKLEALAHNPFVAFEVDEIDGTFDWRSVVAHGTSYMMPKDGSRIEQAQFARALRALRTFVPETLDDDDPTPLRLTVYGIHIDTLVGRAAEQTVRSVRGARLPKPHEPDPLHTPDGF